MPVLRVDHVRPCWQGPVDLVVHQRQEGLATGDVQVAPGVGEVVLDVGDDKGGAIVVGNSRHIRPPGLLT
jgi:hypothetical protein